MKKCSKCLIEKDISLFSRNIKNSDGLSRQCKECKKEVSKIYRDNNKEKIRERNKKFNDNNKDYFRKYAIENKDSLKDHRKKYIEKNKERLLEKKRDYNKNNRIRNREYLKKYRSENKEKFNKYYEKSKESKKIYYKIYYEKNKEIIKKKRNEYFKKRRSVDNLFKLSCNIRTMISLAVNRKYTKYSKTIEILGCSFEELKIHLEKNFQDWMSWDNYGLYNGELNYGWDIDHIIPLKTATTEDAIIQLNHFSNLQPLCSKVNRDIKKGTI